VQKTLEEAIAKVVGAETQVLAAGRTDAGAHAVANVISFNTASELPVETLQRAINAYLPLDIAISSAQEVSQHFHPRFDAVSRTYRYLMWNSPIRSPLMHSRSAHVKPPLREDAMHEAAQCLLGRHDFSSFTPSAESPSTDRAIYRALCWREGNLIHVELEGTGFMRQMVRAIVGTLVDVGRGRLSIGDFRRILSSADRTKACETMPAQGLYLMRVTYPTTERSSQSIAAPEASPAAFALDACKDSV